MCLRDGREPGSQAPPQRGQRRAGDREARQKAGTPRARRKLKRPWEPETGAMPHSSDSSDSSSFSQSPPPSKQVKQGPFPRSPPLESPLGWAMGGQDEGWHPPLLFSQRAVAGLSRNCYEERDVAPSREPWQEPQPPSWVQVERGGTVPSGCARGNWGAGTPGHGGACDTRWAGSRQELRCESRCSGEEPERSPPRHGPARLGQPAGFLLPRQHLAPKKVLPFQVCFVFCPASEVFHHSNA